MAHRDEFYTLKTQTLFLLWIVVVINCLEIVLCIAHAVKLSYDFWNGLGVLIYSWWSMLGIIASGSGIYGIQKNKPDILGKNAMYFLYSALVKGILMMVSLKSAAFGLEFDTVITYAISGPLMFTIVRFINDRFLPIPMTLAYLFVLIALLGIASQLKRFRNAMLKKNAHSELELEENGEIRMG